MKSDAGLAALAVGRRLAARRGALAATAAVTLAAAYFAVRVAVAWEVTLPQAAQQDLRASPDAAIVATSPLSGGGPSSCGTGPDAAPANLRTALSSGRFTADAMMTSDSLSLASLPGLTPGSLIKAYCASSVRDHAALTAGHWPDSVLTSSAIPVAVPDNTLAALKLHLGSTLALTDAESHARVELLVVGVFHRSQNPAAYWAWDPIGASGAQIVGSYTHYDSVVADASAFSSGALHADSSTLLVLPPATDGSAAGLAWLSGQASSITDSLGKDSNPWYTVSGALAADLSALGAAVVTAHAQLLAACLLLGAVAAAGLLGTTGLLVGVGAEQGALSRARGAGRRHLLTAHWPELVLLCAAAAASVPIGTATAHVGTPATWIAAGTVALLAVTVLCLRAVRPQLPGDVATARGRQAPLAYGLRLGADLVLVALAALALWQSAGNPLAGRGPGGLPGADLVVAAAPALAVAAGAGLAGRLVPAAARLAEHGAARARRLATVFAFWQVGRTPLGYVLPALVTVAAVAGGTFAVAQNASWQRSVRDQGAYSAGAEVVVTTPWSQSIEQAAEVTHARGVLAATPVERLPGSQGGSLLALDAGSADQTVLLRPDLAHGSAPGLWSRVALRPLPGLAIPGQPTGLAISAQLSVSEAQLAPATVVATVQDAAGLVYQLGLGSLAADGRVHTLSGTFSTAGQPDYPLRVLRFDVSYTAPAATNASATLSVLALAAAPEGGRTAIPFASGDKLASWTTSSTWSAGDVSCSAGPNGVDTPVNTASAPPQVTDTKTVAGGGWTLDFSTGAGLNFNGDATCTPIPGSVALSAGIGTGAGAAALPALATDAYLHSTGTSVGATVPISVNGITVPALIVASVAEFPTLSGAAAGGLVVDLPALSADLVAHGGTLPPPTEWWLRTVGAAVPADLPAYSSAVTAAGLTDQLAHDPLSAAVPQVLTLGAADLVLLAGLSLAACLVAAGRRQAAHDPVLSALGAGRRERAAIRLLLNLAIVAPTALLGWGLGLAVSRELVPVFVLTPGGTAPVPTVLLTTRPGWSALAVLWLLAVGIAAALDLRPRTELPGAA